ncbi:MATE family efflux transporter [Maribellus maritimus]|uniref:MATE family efflux transporter n=1 Tax=Maribellus maritimus TaxID=2870838 RepID=UPI001EEC8755|nr:MATE family efflux transporter [Maribellus maritimus]MCG6186225.1 MATE family efflux transporter [Maribellus maritimus]
MRRRSKNLTEGNIKKQLYTLTWPMLFGMTGMVIFNLVDTYFVGRLGVNQLAAMSFSFPIVMFVNSLSQGIGIGTSSLVSRNIISESRGNVRRMASRAVLLGVIVVAVFVTIGLNTMRPVFSSLGAGDAILDYVIDYMGVWYFGVPFVVIPMIGNNIVRATGDTFLPGMLMVSSAVVNIILDPMLIFGFGPIPAMGIKGAALATVIGRSVGLVFILFVLIRRENLLTVRFGRIKEILETWKNVLYIAGPAAIGMLITPVSIGFITKIIAGFGKEAVAAFGVASRVEMFALMVIVSLGSVLIIFIGQNISKNQFARIFHSLNYSMKFSMLWGMLVFVLFIVLGKPIASVFTDDPMVIDIARKYFYIVGSSYGFQGLLMLSASSFNGINKPYPSAIFSIVRMVVLYAPLAWVGAKIIGISGVFWAGFIANIVVGVLSFRYLHKTVHKLKFATKARE